ncbi:S9 family peptidase [Ferruginibacter paludis]|uniref:S9 family peptidase n=1 Tax=Ferruginibacter paludis TaxID=1310417 RepID=UPI0025B5AC4A|nr:S9 family peptidase [Ferruginibacter paludis]MDN3656488.1 S9 family peptidase [Ferruginibacter paludis]
MKYFFLLFFFFTQLYSDAQPTPPLLKATDLYRLPQLKDCKASPDGMMLAYVVATVDTAKDKTISHVWVSSVDGKTTLRMTNGEDGDFAPQWSPDGKYLSFLSSRNISDDSSSIWLLDRRGGEGQKLLDVKGKLTEYVWRPDGAKIAMVIKDADTVATPKPKNRKPFVIDRYHFKQDIEGYLDSSSSHIYLFDVATKKLDTLTKGIYNETGIDWSPDGTQLAFVSNRSAAFDYNDNTDIWTIKAVPGSEPRQITTWKGSDDRPVWSPDGTTIAYLQSSAEDDFTMYGQNLLCVVDANGGTPRRLSAKLDRPVNNPHWSKDSKSVAAIVTDNRNAYAALFSITDGSMKPLGNGQYNCTEMEALNDNNWAVLGSTPQIPYELYLVQHNDYKRLTHQSDSFLTHVSLANVEGFESISKDGTKVSGILYTPPNVVKQKLPLILFIHGGPVAEDEFDFDAERQVLACAGYAVAAVNYRGSNGRGIAFCKAIYADWGNKEVKDIIGAANYLIAKGIADSARMGIGGWSYGGILTDYVIATDNRFKAASSGAGSALQLSMYGVDQYINQYNNELGRPWEHPDRWIKLSYPFFKASKIKTPTLFMASQNDFNVPVEGAEQMYTALKTLGIPTQLVIYPGQYHGITVPSYQADRLQRWIKWYDKYLKY